jgi:cell division protein FtsA
MFDRKEIVTAVDVGTAKICVVVAEMEPEGTATVLGFGERPSGGAVKKGDWIDMNVIGNALTEAAADAETSAGHAIDPDNVLMTVSGAHVESCVGTGSVAINGPERIVREEHVRAALKSAMIVPLPRGKEIFNTFDSYFVIDDDQDRRLSNPIGQVAAKLTAIVHILYGDVARIENLTVALRNLGFDDCLPSPVFSGLASAYGALRDLEMEAGVLLLDLGAGTTEYVMFRGRGVVASGVIPIGCDHAANDLSLVLELGIATCRKALVEQAYLTSREKGDFAVELRAPGGSVRRIPARSVEKIVEARLEELFSLIRSRVEACLGNCRVSEGVVLTGGGALLCQAPDILSSVFHAPVRTALPDPKGAVTRLRDPRYCAVCGLLRHWNNSPHDGRRKTFANPVRKLDRACGEAWKRLRETWKAFRF